MHLPALLSTWRQDTIPRAGDLLQAKVSELEQKVAEQQRAMTVLLQDKANLESRVNIFVRVLQMRDEQIEQIRSGQRVSDGVHFDTFDIW